MKYHWGERFEPMPASTAAPNPSESGDNHCTLVSWTVYVCFLFITKTSLFKHTENFTTKQMKILR